MLAHGTCLDTGRCDRLTNCGAIVGRASLRGQKAWDHKDFPKLQHVFAPGTHTVLIRVWSHLGCFGDWPYLLSECNSGGFVDFQVISSELLSCVVLAAARQCTARLLTPVIIIRLDAGRCWQA